MEHKHRAAMACVLLAQALTAVGLMAADERQTERFLPSTCLRRGIEVVDGHARLCSHAFGANGDGRIWFEAENASLLLPGPACIVRDKKQSGGRYVCEVEQARYVVASPTAGRYRLWARVHWRGPAANSNYISLDGATATVLGNMEGPEFFNRWIWIKGPLYDLAAGAHNVTVTRRERNVWLDCFVLADDGYKPGADATGSANPQPCAQGVIETEDFMPPGVTKWDRLSIAGAQHPAGIAAFGSTDKGNTWSRIAPRGDLSAFKPKGDGRDSIRFRVVFRREPGRPPPSLEAFSLTYQASQRGMLSLSNEHLRLTFVASTGELWDMANLKTGACYTPAHRRTRVFELYTLDPESHKPTPMGKAELHDAKLEKHDGLQTLLLSYRLMQGHVKATCRVSLENGPMSSWTLEVRNDSAADIVEEVFPILSVSLADPSDDVLIMPHELGGERIVCPTAGARRKACVYPGDACMQWMDLHDATSGGLYLASYDKSMLRTGLEAESDAGSSLRLQVRKYAYVPRGRTWACVEAVVGIHQGDWHWAADRYREWARTWMQKPQTPVWVNTSDGWLINGIRTRFSTALPGAMRRALESGLVHVESWGQMMPGVPFEHANCYRFPLPDPVLGTEEEFKQAIATVHGMGGKVGFYVNGWAWNPRYPALNPRHKGLIPPGVPVPDWEAGFKRFAVKLYDGSYKPWYGKPANDPSDFPCAFYSMCPMSKGWQDHLYYWVVKKYANEYGVDGMYLDCVSRTGTYCFDLTHGHEHHGQCHFATLLPRLKQGGIKARGEFFLAMEGCCDVYGQWVDMHLICPAAGLRGWSAGVWPEVFRYTFPDYLLYDGFANGLCGATAEKILCGVFLLGTRFDGVRTDAFGQQALALRRDISDVLYSSRFMDTVGLATSDPLIAAKLFVPKDDREGEALVTVWNRDNRTGGTATIALPSAHKAKYCYVYSLAARPSIEKFRGRDGKVTVALPETTLSALVLTRSPRVSAAVGDPTRTCPGKRSLLEVTFANPAPVAASVDVSLELPKGWSATGPGRVALAASGESVERYGIECPADSAPRGSPLTVALRSAARTTVVHRLVPVVSEWDMLNLLSDGSFEHGSGWGLGGRRPESSARYDSTVAHKGRCSLKLSNTNADRRVASRQTYRGADLAGKRFRLSAWCKTQDIVLGERGKGAVVRIILYKDAKRAAAPWVFTNPLEGTRDWTRVEATFTAAEHTQWIGFELFIWKAKGAAWWDDVVLEEVAGLD